MMESDLRDQTIPVLTYEDAFLRVMVLEHDRRSCVLRGLQDSRPNEPWRICSPDELKAGRLAMLQRVAKPGESAKQTAARIAEEQFFAGKKGRK